jgi:hypothetical protein
LGGLERPSAATHRQPCEGTLVIRPEEVVPQAIVAASVR